MTATADSWSSALGHVITVGTGPKIKIASQQETALTVANHLAFWPLASQAGLRRLALYGALIAALNLGVAGA